ncbi:pyridoxamine 5'-phosphate oxidase family protein [Halobacterium wangiae]|uniref:pyridoxamine 5'-phosphate oxidase family protein n=1 Tax=Halobacterium wangiae TaxID=2902623 RepID=UPI001E474C9F|nr:pyridoxamine 5'-phosphate oxidase family protein [Halobacterium wangiae]
MFASGAIGRLVERAHMERPDEADRTLRGVPMTEHEREAFLRERGQGVLSLARDGDAYGVPVSFGYDDGTLYFVLLQFGEDSEKLDFAEATGTATFSTFEFEDEHHWQSLVARGPLELVPEADREAVDDVMFDNARFASLFPHGEPITDHPRYRLVPEETTGQKGQGHDY